MLEIKILKLRRLRSPYFFQTSQINYWSVRPRTKLINTHPPAIFKGLGRDRNRGIKGGKKRGKKPQTNFKERGEKTNQKPKITTKKKRQSRLIF